MTCARLVGVLVLGLLVAGCRPVPKTESASGPADQDRVRSLRESFLRVNPNTRVGIVSAVAAPERLVAVSDIPVQDFKVGDAVLFYDANESLINRGQVVHIVPDALHVKYDDPGQGQRAPVKGDIAIHVLK